MSDCAPVWPQRFVMCTTPVVDDLNQHLLYIYKNIYVEYVAKNPLSLYTPVIPRKKKAPPTNSITHGKSYPRLCAGRED